MRKPTVLVIEDDTAIRRGLVDALEFQGYAALEAADADAGRRSALEASCDLVLLDLVLPRGDGLRILEEIRARRPGLPVLVMTARGGEDDRVRGLRLGADDYVVKPFSVRELLARVEAVLRRSPGRIPRKGPLEIQGRTIDLDCREVRFEDGTSTALSERESELLEYLAVHAGRTVSREEILTQVWRLDPRGVETRTIDMHVARLREKLRDDAAEPRILRTVRGRGYVLESGETSP
jgi:DNA-binding response OmpR family regulator